MKIRVAPFVVALSFLGHFASADVILHPDLEEEHRRAIQYDLAVLDRLAPKDDDDTSAAAAKMGITGKVDATSLREWLETRLRYVVPQSWEFKSRITTTLDSQPYPNPGVFPVLETATKQATDGPGEAKPGEVTIVMMNLGTSLYFSGKKLAKLITLEIDPRHRERILSPRLGLIKVGQGLFSKRFRADTATANTPGNALMRLGTFFHESRHSDGNGLSLGFIHAVCPDDPSYGPYAGMHACDRNRNGPYTVGKAVMKVMLKQCDSCSEPAKEAIRAKILDSASRVIQMTRIPPNELSVATLKAKVLLCDIAPTLKRAEDPDCPDARRRFAEALLGSSVATTDIDPAPESITR